MISIKASDETIQTRKEICNNCEHKKKMTIAVDLCSQCGCIIAGKIRLKSSECPVGKWSKEE